MYQTLRYGHVDWYRGCRLCTRLVTIWSCGGVQTLWIMYQTYYHMVMWNGTEVVDNVPDILPYGHVEWYRDCGLCTRHYHMVKWSGTEVVYNVPDMWSGTDVVDYVADITIWSCGVGQRLWIMYQTCGVVQKLWIMPQTYYHMVMWSGTEVVDNVPDITIWSCGLVRL